jgi:CubicO group peptidase (beta-lactamase class C family)
MLTLFYPSNAFANESVEIPFKQNVSEIQRRIDNIVVETGVPSVSVAISMNDKQHWAYASGLADKRNKRNTTSQTPYRLASVTKPITSIAVMMLVDDGLLDLDKPINDYLKTQKVIADVGNASDVTARLLLQHRAGLPLHYNLIHAGEDYTPRTLDETIAEYGRVMLPINTTDRYSNIGYSVLERAIEEISGLSYAEFLQTRLFDPLNLKTAGVVTSTEHPKGIALPYTHAGDEYHAYDMDTKAAGAVYMSAPDLAKIGQMVNQALDGKSELLSANSAHTMLAPKTPPSEDRLEWYVLGWVHELRGENKNVDTVYHLGSTPGVRAELWVYPEKNISIATLVNEMSWTPLKKTREAVLSAVESDIAFIPYPETQLKNTHSGRYSGAVRISDKHSLNVNLHIDNKGNPSVTLEDETLKIFSVREADDGYIYINTLPADISHIDVKRQPYTLGFVITKNDEGFVGYVSANRVATRMRDSGNYSFSVSLKMTD